MNNGNCSKKLVVALGASPAVVVVAFCAQTAVCPNDKKATKAAFEKISVSEVLFVKL